ncbi:hypothetical protein MKZ38_007449 [Zalerion maritima]|uniref:Uncharacterized protein n=1 Tax=Zalerion maritima TaxID=339359 RepID=A0AAD5WN92_9PEZI|nr:hypothetical protein MKZ38_007449 [Zalerion maritima]
MAPGNRSSLIGVQPLPIITENPNDPPIPSPSPPLSTPPASSQTNSSSGSSGSPNRRSLPHQRTPSPSQLQVQAYLQGLPGGQRVNPPYSVQVHERPSSWHSNSNGSGNGRIIPPPAAAYYRDRPRSNGHNYGSRGPYEHHYRSHSNSSGSAEKELVPVIIPLPHEDRDWFTQRGGWWRVALYSALFVVIAVGLGVGLSIGLKKQSDDGSDSGGLSRRDIGGSRDEIVLGGYPNEEATATEAETETLPTGTFDIIASLVDESEDCSDDWECAIDPSTSLYMAATVSFALEDDGYYRLFVEGTPFHVNGLISSSMSLEGEGTEHERLEFHLSGMDKTVDACVFETDIEIAIWTKKIMKNAGTYAATIAQTSTGPSKSSRDEEYLKRGRRRSDGKESGDKDGTCGCWYSNF